MCDQLLALSDGQPDTSLPLVANEQMAILLFFKGELSEALEHFERAFRLYDPSNREPLREIYGEDIGVFIRIWMAWDLWLLGFPDRARDMSCEAVELGDKAEDPFSHAYALVWSSVVHAMRRERDQARELLELAVAVSEESHLEFLLGAAQVIRAWTRIDPQEGDDAVGRSIAGYGEALRKHSVGGNQVCGPQLLCYLADAQCERGQVTEGLGVVGAALMLSKGTQQHYWDAELRRVKGKLLLRKEGDANGEAEDLFRRALDLALA